MKAFIKNDKKDFKFRYPDQMEKILAYLNENGKLQISERTVEKLYRDFSEEKYSASWMTIADDSSENNDFPDLLEDFADYLSEIDI